MIQNLLILGDPTTRTFNETSFAQQAISFKCLNFEGESPSTNWMPRWEDCPAGIRAQVVCSFYLLLDNIATKSRMYRTFLAVGME